ncbi:MAG: VWA domain-containing protein [Vicinamibacterales bacterium]
MDRPVIGRAFSTVAVAAVMAASLTAAQVFRAGTDLVLLSVTVTDAKNHSVATLNREDFQVLEDGVGQEVTVFSREAQPISLSLLLDTSTSMESKLGMAQEAAIGFCRRLGPRDVAQIITFASETQIRQPFTHDSGALETAIRQIHAGGSTSLYTALYIALNELNRARRAQAPDEIRRQAIVVLSDGENTSGLLGYEDVLDLARRSNVAVYAIGLRSAEDRASHSFNEADFVLRSLAQTSGARLFLVDQPAQLPAIYTQIADELANQYTVGYISKNAKRDGAWRQITVRVRQAGVTARTKSGYFAPAKDK